MHYKESMKYISSYYDKYQSQDSGGDGIQTNTDEEDEDFRNLASSNINRIQAEVHVNQKGSTSQDWGRF
jgi:hypothetical protein